MRRVTPNRKLGLAGLAVILLAANHVAAQSPPDFTPTNPTWTVDHDSGSMVLLPSASKVALGLPKAEARLHVLDPNNNVTNEPGRGYLILGQTSLVHMQLDRNDIRVAGPIDGSVGDLYLQRFGGPIVVHGAEDLDSRVYITADGSIGVATSDPRLFAIDRELIGSGWAEPPGALAVDGDIYAERIQTRKLDVVDRLRIGRPINPSNSGAARDHLHVDAKLQVGGKISAQQVVVHINKWADDVFDADYELMPLDAVEAYVQREGHLPGVPPQSDVERVGIDLAQTNEVLLRKVEELTLHAIDQQKRIDELERRIDALAD